MVKSGLKDDFGHQILEWDETVIHIKYPEMFLGQPDLNKNEILEVVMHTTQQASTRESTERLVKILGSTYAKA